jgi:outer membrane receptor protein involved in Fe transport
MAQRRDNSVIAIPTRMIGLMAISISLGGIVAPSAATAQPDTEPETDPADSTPEPSPVIPEDNWEPDSDVDLDGSVDLLFEDFDIVITASRSEQTSNMTSVPVSILSADDIHYSGVSELPQLLAFIPGVDALQLDRNRWAIGVRGLHQTFSDRTLFLLNGRNASNPVYGGVDFQVLPIFLEDIKQVETVRGPGGAAWGANAFNGVINIIEKSPRETTGVMISQRISEDGDYKTNLRIGDAKGKLAWRFSAEYNDFDATNTSYAVPGTALAPANPKDFLRSQRYGLDAVYDFNEDTSLDFGVAGSHVERGDSPFLAFQAGIDERLDFLSAHAKLSHTFNNGASGYLQWYGTYQDVNRPSMFRYSAYDNNIDGQYSFEPSDEHKITVGGTLRIINLNFTTPRTTDSLPAGVSSEQWAGLFASDRWTISDDWTLETQLRTDWYSETQLDWSGRMALLRSMGPGDDHVVRIAMAKAFRTPQTGLRDLSSARIPIGGGLSGVNLIPAGDVDNEEIYSIELGYTGKIRDGLTIRADTYLQYYQDLSGIILLPEPAPVVGRSFFTIDNIGSANAWGFETELKYTREKATLSLWYAYNDFEFNVLAQNARAFLPAKHKVGATARVKATDWLTLNANYRYTDTTPAVFTTTVKPFHRLDLTATFTHPDLNAELQIGVTDVLDQTDLLIYDQTARGIAQQTPGRTFFIQLHYTF